MPPTIESLQAKLPAVASTDVVPGPTIRFEVLESISDEQSLENSEVTTMSVVWRDPLTWVDLGGLGISNQSVVQNDICRMRIRGVIAGWWFEIFGED